MNLVFLSAANAIKLVGSVRLVDSLHVYVMFITNFIKPHMGSWYLIIFLEITVQSSAMDVWTVTFRNWL